MAVTFKLYQSDGMTPVYTFPVVFSANYPHSEKKIIEHENVRGKGSIIIDGGESAWDLTLRGAFSADGYDDLMVLVDAMETAIALNTKYVLKITKNQVETTDYSYNVKRITPIETSPDNIRTNYLEYIIVFRVNSW